MYYEIFSLGDSALTVSYGNTIDESVNKEVIARFEQFKKNPIPGQVEIVPAYSSLTIYYNPITIYKNIKAGQSVFEWVKIQAEERLDLEVNKEEVAEDLVRIPVCYDEELAMDLKSFCEKKQLTVDELIRVHTAKQYKVYMMGFIPGFSYMGEVDEQIVMPRKPQPEMVLAGSVGIAGKQTGIYPLDSPGGWQIIGRTPLKIFDASREQPSIIKAGDRIQFYPISKDEFTHY